MLAVLKSNPVTDEGKARYILATYCKDFAAEYLTCGQNVACVFKKFSVRFGFFLTLVGVTAVRQISENAFDTRVTRDLNLLYVELLKRGSEQCRRNMSNLLVRLVFFLLPLRHQRLNLLGMLRFSNYSTCDGKPCVQVIGGLYPNKK